MSHRFFVDGDTLAPEQCRQIATVLRLTPGAIVTLVHDGDELDYRLDEVAPSAVRGTVVARRPAADEPHVTLTLGLPLLRGDRSEAVIEAASQLGVSRFAPYASARSVVRTLSADKRERWRRIAREAAETARRGRVPTIDETRDWPALLAALPGPLVVAWEEERERGLEAALEVLADGPAALAAAAVGPGPLAELSLVVGPEGGLAEDEVALARERGGITASLGRRVLRAETAAIAAVARVIAALD